MLRCLFSTLFLLLVCSTFCVPSSYASAPGAAPTTLQDVELFKKNTCVIQRDHGAGSDVLQNNKIENVDSVFLVMAGDLLVAVAEAYPAKTGDGSTYNFVGAYPEKKKGNWEEEIFNSGSYDICSKWKTEVIPTNIKNDKSFFTEKNVVYDADKNKIYLLAVNNTLANDNQWEYNLFVGDVSGKDTATQIAWSKAEKKDLKFSEFKNFEDKLKLTEKLIESSSTHGGAFITNEGKSVFMLRAQDEGNKNYAIVFVGLKEGATSNSELNVLHVEKTAKDCYPYFFLWGEKIIMITTNCSDDAATNRNVKESSNIADWKENSGPFHYSSEFLKDKTSFTTAFISDTNVLLFAQQKNEGTAGCTADKKCFSFWFSDGNRTHNVEKIVVLNEEVVSGSLIYVKEKLYFLYQKSDSSGTDKKFFLTCIEEQLQKIKATLIKWKEADDAVLKLCQAGNSDSEANCSAPLPTKGLVGFLSNGKIGTTEWEDMYLYKNADITKGTKFENGLKCSGAGQGAKWLINGGDEKDQLYEFTKNGFTLVAMLTIDGNIKNNDNSLLGLVLNKEEPKRFGLWCTKDGKWAVSIGDKSEKKIPSPEVICKHNEIYFVALILKNNKILSVYVDGQELRGLDSGKMKIEPSQNIDYFYFGSDENLQQNTDVTLTNVLLYNRPFTTEEEIKTLKPKKKEVNTQKLSATDDGKSHDSERSATQTDSSSTSGTSPTENEKNGAQSSSQPPTTEDSVARVGVVGVLSFMLFGVFTLLGRYVY